LIIFVTVMTENDDSPHPRRRLTPQQALLRIRKYCAYQERSQQEVRDKLYSFGMHSGEVEGMVAALIADGFLKEERFAIAYANGKLRISHWGAAKIRQGLAFKKVSEPVIRIALEQISPMEYASVLSRLISKKQKTLHEKNVFKRNYKLAQYCIRQGFESELVWEMLRKGETE
jgi:regulatory protein